MNTATRAESMAGMIRRHSAPWWVLTVLRWGAASGPKLARTMRSKYAPGTVAAGLRRLRDLGVVEWTGKREKRAKVWRAV